MNEAQNTQTTSSVKSRFPELSPREIQLIEYLEKEEGQLLSQQEVNLALAQAHQIGHL